MVPVPVLNGTQSPSPPPPHLWALPASHLPPGFNALVDIVRVGAAGNEAASPLGHVQVAIFQHDFALADDHQRSPAQLHPFKDVVLCSLETGARDEALVMGAVRTERGTRFSCAWDPAFSIPRN